MKIGIVTHPIAGNYGGMLQAYALHKALSDMGYSPFILEKNFNHKIGKKQKIKNFIYTLCRYFFPDSHNRPLPFSIFQKLGAQFKKDKFLNLNIIQYSQLNSYRKKHQLQWIVGSDQVWRGLYARWISSLPYYFLNFATQNEIVRSISYAASFGSDIWEGNEEETEICSKLIRTFKAISVREHDGIRLCKNTFSADAECMPDPTLLLSNDEYNHIINSKHVKPTSHKYIATYILDNSTESEKIICSICKQYGFHSQNLYPLTAANKLRDRFPMDVSHWLKYIRDCDYFITDSFHGCVFSIIFNKPFICLGNPQRGISRLKSLLSFYGLSDRFITKYSDEKIYDIFQKQINWTDVNIIREGEREKGLNFLKQHLIK